MNGFDRMPKTAASRVRFENYLRTLGHGPSFSTILRLARIAELRGWFVDGHADGLYDGLRSLHPDFVDCNNRVLNELHRRHREREENPPARPVVTLDEWLGSVQ